MRWVILALALASCTPSVMLPDGGPSDAGPLSLSLGTGQHEFTPIAQNQTLLIARGCQGLQHVWISLRATGIAPRGVHVQLWLTRTSDEVMVSAELDTAITFTPNGERDDLSGLMLVIPLPDAAIGQPLRLEGQITDREGRGTSATVPVTIAWGTEVCGT